MLSVRHWIGMDMFSSVWKGLTSNVHSTVIILNALLILSTTNRTKPQCADLQLHCVSYTWHCTTLGDWGIMNPGAQ